MGQDVPPQNMPLWHEDYFDVKAIENQHMQEKFSAIPLAAYSRT